MIEKDERKFVKIQAFISKTHMEKLEYYSKRHGLPMSRLVAIAIDNELYDNQERIPFKWDYKLPEEEYEEYAFADQAGKILTFLKSLTYIGMSLDALLVCRHDIGVPDKATFLAAFKEILDKDIIEAFTPPTTIKSNKSSNESVNYRVKTGNPAFVKKVKKKNTKEQRELAIYNKMKKKLEGGK